MIARTDAEVGEMLREARKDSCSQSDLARQMKALGFGWYQQTVQRVESGVRPLRATELLALRDLLPGVAAIIDTSSEDASELARLRQFERRILRAVGDAFEPSNYDADDEAIAAAIAEDAIRGKRLCGGVYGGGRPLAPEEHRYVAVPEESR